MISVPRTPAWLEVGAAVLQRHTQVTPAKETRKGDGTLHMSYNTSKAVYESTKKVLHADPDKYYKGDGTLDNRVEIVDVTVHTLTLLIFL